MRADEGLASAAAAADRPTRGARLRGNVALGAFWLFGSVVVALAQPGSDRELAAAGAAVAGVATILIVSRLTQDPGRRYFRSLVGAMIAVSVVGDWLVQRLTGSNNAFQVYGLDTRIALPLIFVLLAPPLLRALPVRLRSRALWRERALILREARPMDWLVVAYVLLIVPDLALGLHHHAPKTYIAQDLGLIVFFVFAYMLGRTVNSDTSRDSAAELVYLLMGLAVTQALFGWATTPIFTYVEAACAGAVAFALLQPKKTQLLPLGMALAFLGADAVAIARGSGSTKAVELAAALGVIAYLVLRVRNLLPQWVVVGLAVAALAGFLALTADGATVRGQYNGIDQSNLGRTYEAYQVQATIRRSPVSFVFGRGLGGSIDETHAPQLFASSIVYGGRDLAHVQEVHLLPYEFLLKYGLLGFVLLAAFVVGVAVLAVCALESASRNRDPTLVVYAALPLLGVAAALAAATHLQDNPLNAFAVGVLITRLDRKPVSVPALRFALPTAALVFAVVGVIAFTRPLGPPPGVIGGGGGPVSIALPRSVHVGDLRFNYPLTYKRRFFKTSSLLITHARGARVHGVVVASYPLKPSPELGGAGEALRSNGVFFELYRVVRERRRLAPAAKFPLTIFDFATIRGLKSSTEAGSVSFSVKGSNYRAILWVGAKAPQLAQIVIDEVVGSIRIR